jgi:hypothetical protein
MKVSTARIYIEVDLIVFGDSSDGSHSEKMAMSIHGCQSKRY